MDKNKQKKKEEELWSTCLKGRNLAIEINRGKDTNFYIYNV